jgi:hypothetical protein
MIYRALSGNFNLIVTKLDTVLRNLYTSTLEYIICTDINLNGLIDSERKSQLEALLQTYNLTRTLNIGLKVYNNLLSHSDT